MKQLIQQQREFFESGATKELRFRREMLKKLRDVLRQNEQALYEAIYEDFAKSEFDTYTAELALIYHEIDLALRKLGRWAAPKRVGTNFLNFPGKSYVIIEPLGVSLVIGAWNYPYQLSLGPCVAAMAAGCTVVLKPSELPANSSRIMARIINEQFDARYFAVVEGGVEETTQLLDQRFDKIFFTGSTRVGRIVYEAAARNLTPVTLELGGKSPAIFCEDADLGVTVKRLVWGKFLNAGQTCIAPDYILVPREMENRLLERIETELASARYEIENGNYVRIINKRNFERLKALIDPDKVFLGGETDETRLLIQPTVMRGVQPSDAVMQEEIFGPVLPVLSYENLDEAIELVRSGPRPLSCYLFTASTKTRKRILKELSFGGGTVNDVLMHITNPQLPFGGVGQSGMGAYHGEEGFLAFSHKKSILERPTYFEPNLKYFPQTKRKLWWIKQLLKI